MLLGFGFHGAFGDWARKASAASDAVDEVYFWALAETIIWIGHAKLDLLHFSYVH